MIQIEKLTPNAAPNSGEFLDHHTGAEIDPLADLVARVRACRICVDTPDRTLLPHAPRPVLRPSRTARLCIASQAPGVRVHASGTPFTDPSGDRLRQWLGVTVEEFYDTTRVAIVPMGFCFPGHDANGGDLPPRKECARAWHGEIFRAMPQLELVLLVGSYAQRWHRPQDADLGMTAMVRNWRTILETSERPRYLPMPHPSWRNNGWIRKNPWFEEELLPALRGEARRLL